MLNSPQTFIFLVVKERFIYIYIYIYNITKVNILTQDIKMNNSKIDIFVCKPLCNIAYRL